MNAYLINDNIINIEANNINIIYYDIYNESFLINILLKKYLTKIKMEIDKCIEKWDVYKNNK